MISWTDTRVSGDPLLDLRPKLWPQRQRACRGPLRIARFRMFVPSLGSLRLATIRVHSILDRLCCQAQVPAFLFFERIMSLLKGLPPFKGIIRTGALLASPNQGNIEFQSKIFRRASLDSPRNLNKNNWRCPKRINLRLRRDYSFAYCDGEFSL